MTNPTNVFWLQENYGAQGELMIRWGKTLDYLSMEIDYSVKGKVKIGMIKYEHR
jgi:hypothetical protein